MAALVLHFHIASRDHSVNLRLNVQLLQCYAHDPDGVRAAWQVFNSRTCQLVLGAGALAAAGLRSITAKHLALAAQCVGAVMALHPSLSAAFTGPLPAARRAILLPDFERVLQVGRLNTQSKVINLDGQYLGVYF